MGEKFRLQTILSSQLIGPRKSNIGVALASHRNILRNSHGANNSNLTSLIYTVPQKTYAPKTYALLVLNGGLKLYIEAFPI